MAQDFTLITFHDGSSQARLYTVEQCEAAVQEGRIRPDTMVTIYRGSESRAMRADAFPLLGSLLSVMRSGGIDIDKRPDYDEDPGERATEMTPGWVGRSLGWNQSPQAPDAYDAGQPRARQPYDDGGRATEVYREPPRERRSDPGRATSDPYGGRQTSGRQTSGGGQGGGGHDGRGSGGGGMSAKWFLLLLLPVLILIGGVVYVLGDQLEWWKGGTKGGDVTDNSSDMVDGVERTFYAVRQVDVQDKARAGTPTTTLPRGTSLSGVVVEDENDSSRKWLRIRYGPQTGRYVALVDLSEKTRPLLDTAAFSGERTLSVAETLRTEPSSSAPAVEGGGALTAGTSVIVAGKVNSDWVETLPTGGGVGYLPISAFGESTAGATPSPTPDTSGGTHQILVSNTCATKSLTIAIYYYDGQRWQTNNGLIWTFTPNNSSYPVIGEKRLLAASDVIYYTAYYGEGSIRGFDDGDIEVNYGGEKVKMRRASLNKLDDGDYEIPFNCDN
ncbi:hypothetical protein FHS96_000513 [Sphingomonas zeicaulis]|uniref:SH3 domain-containing protein n=1 Tax=Sphingomonas zeicaulis TaxID=1632740 RepID=UPI003D229675